MGPSRRLHRSIKWFAAGCLLAGCDGTPTAPESQGAPAEPAFVVRPESPGGTPPEMRAWFAGLGIRLPSVLAPEPTSKRASEDERILGDVTGNGTASSWDLTSSGCI